MSKEESMTTVVKKVDNSYNLFLIIFTMTPPQQ